MYNSFLNKIYLFLESCEQATFYEGSQLTARTVLTFETSCCGDSRNVISYPCEAGAGVFHERHLGGTSASSCVDVSFVH